MRNFLRIARTNMYKHIMNRPPNKVMLIIGTIQMRGDDDALYKISILKQPCAMPRVVYSDSVRVYAYKALDKQVVIYIR